jgi:hypothetical protein
MMVFIAKRGPVAHAGAHAGSTAPTVRSSQTRRAHSQAGTGRDENSSATSANHGSDPATSRVQGRAMSAAARP